jgi:hypothetical protein
LELRAHGNSLAYSADGKILAVGCDKGVKSPGQVQFWDVASATELTSIPVPGGAVYHVRFIPGQPFLVVGGWIGGSRLSAFVEVWDVNQILDE